MIGRRRQIGAVGGDAGSGTVGGGAESPSSSHFVKQSAAFLLAVRPSSFPCTFSKNADFSDVIPDVALIAATLIGLIDRI